LNDPWLEFSICRYMDRNLLKDKILFILRKYSSTVAFTYTGILEFVRH
jgi:hypothetical protein